MDSFLDFLPVKVFVVYFHKKFKLLWYLNNQFYAFIWVILFFSIFLEEKKKEGKSYEERKREDMAGTIISEMKLLRKAS